MGVTKEVIKPGNGPKPRRGQRVRVHYTGTLTNGKKFDSSRDRGQPFQFTLGAGESVGFVAKPFIIFFLQGHSCLYALLMSGSYLAQGWDEGVADMQIGERARLTITPDYGSEQEEN